MEVYSCSDSFKLTISRKALLFWSAMDYDYLQISEICCNLVRIYDCFFLPNEFIHTLKNKQKN